MYVCWKLIVKIMYHAHFRHKTNRYTERHLHLTMNGKLHDINFSVGKQCLFVCLFVFLFVCLFVCLMFSALILTSYDGQLTYLHFPWKVSQLTSYQYWVDQAYATGIWLLPRSDVWENGYRQIIWHNFQTQPCGRTLGLIRHANGQDVH